jgi:hypothetical protein
MRRAAKEHVCCECGVAIKPGERYEYMRGLWDNNGWTTFRTCAICREIRDHFACDGYVIRELWEQLEENLFPDMAAGGPCMEGLSPRAKECLLERCLAWRMESQ